MENVKENIVNIASEMDLTVTDRDINTCHRLGGVRQGNRSWEIIVGLFARDIKHQFLANKCKMREKEDYRKIFISEDLTPFSCKLLQYVYCQEWIESAYTRDGRDAKVHCRMRDRSRITVETPDSLFKLDQTDVDSVALGLGNLQ